jgi:iron complex outermembrane receptor protein
VKGSNYGWDWESALLWNRAENETTSYGRLFLPTLSKLNAGASLAQVAADPNIGHDVLTQNMSQITQWDAKVSHEFGQLAGGAIGFRRRRRTAQGKDQPDPRIRWWRPARSSAWPTPS